MIKINKKITLEFLGDEYKDSFAIFTAIPMKQFEEIAAKTEDIQKDNNAQVAMQFMVDLVKDRFVSGSISQDGTQIDIKKDDLNDFPAEFYLTVINNLSGQNPNV